MKKYINKKATLICLGIAAIIVIISIIVPLIKPKNTTSYKEYTQNTDIFTMNDKSMALDEAYFIAKSRQAYFEEYYLTYGSSFSWDISVEIGKTYEDVILDETLAYIKEVFVLSEYALNNDMALTDNEKKAITTEVDSFFSTSDSKIISATNATEDLVSRVYTRNALYNKVYEHILKDKDLTINPEDARVCSVGIVEINPEKFDSPERVANEIAERVNNGQVVGEVAGIYSATVDKIFVDKDSETKKEITDFCLSLIDDECKVIAVDGIYYAIYCYLENDEVETANKEEELLLEKKAEYISDFVEDLLKENSLTVNTEAWETINFDTPVYTKADIVQTK